MLPRDELRQALLVGIRKIENLCSTYGFKPAADLRKLASEIVQKADESRSITKPVVDKGFDNPYVVWSQVEVQLESILAGVDSHSRKELQKQFNEKYTAIIKHDIIPAIKNYFDSHPRVDMHVFEPLINMKIVGSVTQGVKALKIGQTVKVTAAMLSVLEIAKRVLALEEEIVETEHAVEKAGRYLTGRVIRDDKKSRQIAVLDKRIDLAVAKKEKLVQEVYQRMLDLNLLPASAPAKFDGLTREQIHEPGLVEFFRGVPSHMVSQWSDGSWD